MFLTNFYNQNHNEKAPISDFWLYELSVWLHVIAYSLVGVFVPVLLYKLNFSIGEIMLYFTLYNLIDVPLNFAARSFIVQFGARVAVAVGTMFAIGFFYLFSLLEVGAWNILIAMAIAAAVYDAFYWVGHVYLFTNSGGKDKDLGKKTGVVYIVRKLGSVAAPLVGAAILIWGDVDILFYGSIVVFGLSLMPLLWVDEFTDRPDKPLVKAREFFKHPREVKNYVTTTMFSVHLAAESIIWPLFVFTVFGTIESVALIPLIVGLSTIVLTYFTSIMEKGRREFAIIIGALAIALVWLARVYFEVDFVYHVSVFLVGMFTLLITVPLDSNLFSRGKSIDALQSSTYRNAFHMFSKFVLFGILAILINVFEVSFFAAVVCMLVIIVTNYIFLVRYKTKDDEELATI